MIKEVQMNPSRPDPDRDDPKKSNSGRKKPNPSQANNEQNLDEIDKSIEDQVERARNRQKHPESPDTLDIISPIPSMYFNVLPKANLAGQSAEKTSLNIIQELLDPKKLNQFSLRDIEERIKYLQPENKPSKDRTSIIRQTRMALLPLTDEKLNQYQCVVSIVISSSFQSSDIIEYVGTRYRGLSLKEGSAMADFNLETYKAAIKHREDHLKAVDDPNVRKDKRKEKKGLRAM